MKDNSNIAEWAGVAWGIATYLWICWATSFILPWALPAIIIGTVASYVVSELVLELPEFEDEDKV